MNKKYKLTNEIINVDGYTFYRIKALKDFSNVKKGDKGGFVENEENLSQNGNCWVYNDAKVFDNAKVYDNVKVCNNALVYDNAEIRGNAQVLGYAQVYSNAKVRGNAKVCDNAEIYDNVKVCDNVKVYGNAKVYGDALVCEDAQVYGYAWVCGDARVYGNARVYDNATISSNANVCDNAMVRGKANVYSHADIRGDAEITADTDYIVFKNWWSSGRFFTWTRSNDMWKVGCFYGTGKELIEKAYKDSEISGKEYKRVVDYVNSILNVNEYDSRRKNIKERLLSKMRKLFGK